LKCDIRKFFDSIDQGILLKLIKQKINDDNTLWLIGTIIKSFPKGLPLGNVTSQLFANIYLNEFDQFVKHKLKVKYYLRYCDDFIVLAEDKSCFAELIKSANNFLQAKLRLGIHPDKIILRKYSQGIDFLGYVVLPYQTVVRTKTKRRIFKKLGQKLQDYEKKLIDKESFNQTVQSYLGVLSHAKSYKLSKEVGDKFKTKL
ncbi:MAG: RNA-directed DNA polymerase, partial [Patescibacteria group bacterium]